MPILSGLRYILERGLELDEDDDALSSDGWPAHAAARSCGDAWRSCH
ncbi:MAG TPA: hypothetical protein VJY34_19130 [Roseiarcus sp.]|nr:hypothetical protein [Roseiarcus sp.]